MTQTTIHQAVQTLLSKLVTGDLPAQERAQLAVAINQLSAGQNLEQALVAVAEKHIDDSTTALAAAAKEIQDNSAGLLDIPKIPEKLVPKLIEQIRSQFLLTPWPARVVDQFGVFSSDGPVHNVTLEDFTTGKTYIYSDYGAFSSDSSRQHKASLIELSSGTPVVLSRQAYLTASNTGFGLTPYHDGSVRLFTTTGNPNHQTAQDLVFFEHGKWTSEKTLNLDFPALKVNKADRRLVFVSGGDAKVLSGTQDRVSLNTAVAHKEAFNAVFTEADGWFDVTISNYMQGQGASSPPVTNDQTNAMMYVRQTSPSYQDSRQEFSIEHGLVACGQFQGGTLVPENMEFNVNTNGVQTFPCYTSFLMELVFPATSVAAEFTAQVRVMFPRRQSDSSASRYVPLIVGYSKQLRQLVYKQSISNFSKSDPTHRTVEGIAQGY